VIELKTVNTICRSRRVSIWGRLLFSAMWPKVKKSQPFETKSRLKHHLANGLCCLPAPRLIFIHRKTVAIEIEKNRERIT